MLEIACLGYSKVSDLRTISKIISNYLFSLDSDLMTSAREVSIAVRI